MITVEEIINNVVVDESSTRVIDAREVVIVTGGSGDMAKSIYDSNNDHIVDIAENSLKFDNKSASEFVQKNDIIDCGTF